MTEEEILQAPESDYMNEEQLVFFEQKLLELQSQIESDIKNDRLYLLHDEKESDVLDRAVFEENFSFNSRKISRESNLLERIQASLDRIKNKTYGYCEETGQPIGIPRLIARPTASCSVEAKEKRENQSKLYRDVYTEDDKV